MNITTLVVTQKTTITYQECYCKGDLSNMQLNQSLCLIAIWTQIYQFIHSIHFYVT